MYKKLCDEIRGSFASSAKIIPQDVLSKLPYLDAVVKENLRIHSPLANGFTRVVSDGGGVMISGHWVPQTVRKPCSSMPRSQTPGILQLLTFLLMPRPSLRSTTTVPIHWRAIFATRIPSFQTGGSNDGDKKDVVQPFSVGPRDCPGKRYVAPIGAPQTRLLGLFKALKPYHAD